MASNPCSTATKANNAYNIYIIVNHEFKELLLITILIPKGHSPRERRAVIVQ